MEGDRSVSNANPADRRRPLPKFMQVVLGFGSAAAIESLAPLLKLVSHAFVSNLGHAFSDAASELYWTDLKEAMSAASAAIVVIVALTVVIVLTEKYLDSFIQKVSLIITVVILGAFDEEIAKFLKDQHSIGYYFIVVCLTFVFLNFCAALAMVQENIIKRY